MSSWQVLFRSATASDATEMVSVHFAAVRDVSSSYYSEPVLSSWSPTPDDQRREWLASLVAQDSSICEVATLPAGDLVGFCLALPGQCRLQALYVHPAHSGRGIGASLLKAVESRCHALGVEALELKASYNAEPFYRTNGYAPVRETTQQLADGTAMGAVLMSKHLASGA